MNLSTTDVNWMQSGLDAAAVNELLEQINNQIQLCATAAEAWQTISQNVLSRRYPFSVHLCLFESLFPNRHQHPETAPSWMPTADIIKNANISACMSALDIPTLKAFHQWSLNQFQDFWRFTVKKLNIIFKNKPEQICDLSQGVQSPLWFPGATMNIADSCFNAAATDTAIITQDEHNQLIKISYAELDCLSNQVANGLVNAGFSVGDSIGIAMPMNHYAIAIYLGIIKMGGIVASVPDSFSSEEMAVRFTIAKAKAVFTQAVVSWGGKKISLYEKILKMKSAPMAIVLNNEKDTALSLRCENLGWDDFLSANTAFNTVACDPMAPCHILFSSGTSGEPKAIVWNHTTPIKSASDAFYHQNIQPGDVLAWPTSLGWMMGPWLVFASLINQATMAIYQDAPKNRAFGEFIQNAKVSMLGVVPTLVATWRQSKCMEGLNWEHIKVFSSTGECSNPEDMLYLMSLAGYKPVIEYCGGTEIGGGYLSSTVIENNYPSLFTTPTMGLDIAIIDEQQQPADMGEVAIIPPSIGLSTQLLNSNHLKIYFENMPKTATGKILRRHGDQIKQLANGYFSITGRVDDTMNLGGIKISSAEIERVVIEIPQVIEVAAIAIPPRDSGPSLLIIYAVTSAELDEKQMMKEMQKRINTHLNPLFKIHAVVLVKELPKTASNKIMRRILREQYLLQA